MTFGGMPNSARSVVAETGIIAAEVTTKISALVRL